MSLLKTTFTVYILYALVNTQKCDQLSELLTILKLLILIFFS